MYVNLVKSASIQPRTVLSKFAENSPKVGKKLEQTKPIRPAADCVVRVRPLGSRCAGRVHLPAQPALRPIPRPADAGCVGPPVLP